MTRRASAYAGSRSRRRASVSPSMRSMTKKRPSRIAGSSPSQSTSGTGTPAACAARSTRNSSAAIAADARPARDRAAGSADAAAPAVEARVERPGLARRAARHPPEAARSRPSALPARGGEEVAETAAPARPASRLVHTAALRPKARYADCDARRVHGRNPATRRIEGDPPMQLVAGKVAIVTGSGRGIGRAIAELLAEHGARVVVNDLKEEVAEEAASAIRKKGGEALVVAGSITDPKFPDRLAKTAVDKFGGARHHRQQRRLHPRRRHPQDVRRAVDGDARRAPHRPVPPAARRVALLARVGQGRDRRRQADHAQGHQRLVDLGRRRQRRTGELLRRQDGHRRRHQDAGPGMGASERQRQRRRLRLHRDPPHRRQGRRAPRPRSTASRSSSASPRRCGSAPSR